MMTRPNIEPTSRVLHFDDSLEPYVLLSKKNPRWKLDWEMDGSFISTPNCRSTEEKKETIYPRVFVLLLSIGSLLYLDRLIP
jgi:hypothetical protein